jgi:hypothetical protein
MRNSTGTLRGIMIDGVSYDVMSDCNISFSPTNYEVSGIATTGKTLFQMKKRIQEVESVDLGVDPEEIGSLKSKAESLADLTMAFTLADGSVFRGTGRIHFDKYESETGKATLKLIPNGEFTPFLS